MAGKGQIFEEQWHEPQALSLELLKADLHPANA
jgi:hypothetical protein